MFGITDDHRKVLADAIRGHVQGSESFKHYMFPEERARVMRWAEVVESGEATEVEMMACRHLAFLPYTQPEAELSPIRYATYVAAVVLCNGGDFQFVTKVPATRMDCVLREIR